MLLSLASASLSGNTHSSVIEIAEVLSVLKVHHVSDPNVFLSYPNITDVDKKRYLIEQIFIDYIARSGGEPIGVWGELFCDFYDVPDALSSLLTPADHFAELSPKEQMLQQIIQNHFPGLSTRVSTLGRIASAPGLVCFGFIFLCLSLFIKLALAPFYYRSSENTAPFYIDFEVTNFRLFIATFCYAFVGVVTINLGWVVSWLF